MSFTEKISSMHKPATPKVKRVNSPETLQKTLSRPGSASLINKCLHRLIGDVPKCHGNLSRKVENLEKNNVKWKERAQAWEKEKKSYMQAIENCGKSNSDYYREQLQAWNESRVKKIGIDLNEVLHWIRKQDSETLKLIKNLIAEIDQSSDKACTSFVDSDKFNISLQGTRAMQDIQGMHSMEGCLKDLMEKNEQLSTSLMQIEQELKSKAQGVLSLKEKLQGLKAELLEKESALLDERSLNQALMKKLNDITSAAKGFGMLNESESIGHLSIVPSQGVSMDMAFENELESKDLEIGVLKTQNEQLQCSVLEFKRSNQVYLETIEKLKHKMKMASADEVGREGKGDEETFDDLSSLEELESFEAQDLVDVGVQTCNYENVVGIEMISCMASALEDIIIKTNFN